MLQLRLKHFSCSLSLVFAILFLVTFFWRNLTASTYGKLRLQRSCLLKSNLSGFHIEDLIKDLETIYDLGREECLVVHPVINQIYELELGSSRSLKYNEEFKLKIQQWLGPYIAKGEGGDAEFKTQVISTVYNKWTRSMTARSPLRGKKPRKLTSSINFTMIDDVTNCDFCQGKYAKDIPLSNQHAIAAANSFKLQDFNALFIFKQHNPLKLTNEDYTGMFKLANQWFNLAAKSSRYGHDHPIMSWDSLPPSGGSQIHAHMHGFLGRGHQLGRFRGYQDARQQYNQVHSASDLTQDLINVHVALGLAIRLDSIAIVSPLDPICNHELRIFSSKVDDSFAEMVYLLHRTYVDELQVMSWSSGISWPNDGDLAKLVIGARSDSYPVSSMELFLFSSVISNPYETIDAVKRTLFRLKSIRI